MKHVYKELKKNIWFGWCGLGSRVLVVWIVDWVVEVTALKKIYLSGHF